MHRQSTSHRIRHGHHAAWLTRERQGAEVPRGKVAVPLSIFTCLRSLVSGHLTYREFTCTVTAFIRH